MRISELVVASRLDYKAVECYRMYLLCRKNLHLGMLGQKVNSIKCLEAGLVIVVG